MEEDINKVRKFNSETEGEDAMSIPSLPDDQPDTKLRSCHDDMLDSMNEVDRNILAAAILGVDITAVYSPRTSRKSRQGVWSSGRLIIRPHEQMGVQP